MEKEFNVRLIRHISFLEKEIEDYEVFRSIIWEEYNSDRHKRRNLERWIENIVNSSLDISKIILAAEGKTLPDTYREILVSLSLIPGFVKEEMENLSNWVKLRNIISHEYLDVRWASISKFIAGSRPGYEKFLKSVKEYHQGKLH
ncbi:MAG: DUF86 domain-containing protein [Proteobacteria bacterium]|nr:DUF86 domain-containing protein [Pseudomonadota bacterium]